MNSLMTVDIVITSDKCYTNHKHDMDNADKQTDRKRDRKTNGQVRMTFSASDINVVYIL